MVNDGGKHFFWIPIMVSFFIIMYNLPRGGYMALVKKFILFTVTFFKAIFRLILGLRTPKGLLALFLAFLIYYGWALTFIVYGTITKNPWFISIGTTVVIFLDGTGNAVLGAHHYHNLIHSKGNLA